MIMLSRTLLLSVVLLTLFSAGAGGAVIERKYPDGKLRLKYEIDEQGDKTGSYQEFYPSGQVKLKATYKADQLDGPYETFRDDGKPILTATYKDGKLNGPLTRFENGKPALTLNYKDG